MSRRNTEPVKHTCPDINKIIATITDIVKSMDACVKDDDINDLIDWIHDWSGELTSIGFGRICLMEDLRSSNDALRTWGNELYSEAEQLDSEIDRLQNSISQLEEEIIELKEEIEELKDNELCPQIT